MLALIIASVIDPEAAVDMIDHLLDKAEQRVFDIGLDHHLYKTGEPDEWEEFYKPAYDEAAAEAAALQGLPHRPLRVVCTRKLREDADDGDLEAADELAFRARHRILDADPPLGDSYRLPPKENGDLRCVRCDRPAKHDVVAAYACRGCGERNPYREQPEWLLCTRDGEFRRAAPDEDTAIARHNAEHPDTPALAAWRAAAPAELADVPF